MEGLDRRDLLLGGMGLLILGCAGSRPRQVPDVAPEEQEEQARPIPNSPAPAREPEPVVEAPPSEPLSTLERALPRSAWTSAGVNARRARPMGAITRITVHHEGSPNVRRATGFRENAATLELIRRFHVEARGWADIGYHYVIDPSGRTWEARPLTWQGAHVRGFNDHNVGVMLLGNFELQQPTLEQLIVLPQVVRALRRKYGVGQANIRSHQQWAPTACPGRNLQPRFVAMKREGLFL